MTRPAAKTVMEVGRWQLQRDKNGWIVRNDSGDTRWPSSLEAALQYLYEAVIADQRFNDSKADSLAAMRQAIVRANEMFNELLTAEKIEELNEIVREAGR